MAKPSTGLVAALREAARRLKNGAHYAWGHHGACNCGHLLQVITRLDEADILAHAHTGMGEWTEIAAESCLVTGAPVSLYFPGWRKLVLLLPIYIILSIWIIKKYYNIYRVVFAGSKGI